MLGAWSFDCLPGEAVSGGGWKESPAGKDSGLGYTGCVAFEETVLPGALVSVGQQVRTVFLLAVF